MKKSPFENNPVNSCGRIRIETLKKVTVFREQGNASAKD